MKPIRLIITFAALLAFTLAVRAQTPEEKLAALKLTLPDVPKVIANYTLAARTGSLLYLAGHIPRDAKGKVIAGKVGRTIDEAAATEAAKVTALSLIATLKSELGDLRRVKRIVRANGFVNATDDFTRQSFVINGCSDLLVAIFGEAGKHTRIAIGVASLPLGAAVEVDLVVEVTD